MSTRTPPPLAAWMELNDRQQGVLASIYELDQENETARRRKAAAGDFDDTPAAVWRRIDFAHDPSDRKLFGVTELQNARAAYDLDETHPMIFDEAKDWFDRFNDMWHDTVVDLAEKSGVPAHLLDPWSYQADAEARWLDGDALIDALHLRQ